jgi:DNA-binding CsgD family transcriptional regulator
MDLEDDRFGHLDLSALPHRDAVGAAESREIWSLMVGLVLSFVRTVPECEGDCVLLRRLVQWREPLSGRKLAILERTLLGVQRKVIASDYGVSPSLVAQVLKSALLEMGLTCSPAKVPLALIMLAHAARGATVAGQLVTSELILGGESYLLLSARLDASVWRRLAPAESDVLRERLHGTPYALIAAKRNTSTHTVANQAATACRRLGASGRLELLRQIIAPVRA